MRACITHNSTPLAKHPSIVQHRVSLRPQHDNIQSNRTFPRLSRSLSPSFKLILIPTTPSCCTTTCRRHSTSNSLSRSSSRKMKKNRTKMQLISYYLPCNCARRPIQPSWSRVMRRAWIAVKHPHWRPASRVSGSTKVNPMNREAPSRCRPSLNVVPSKIMVALSRISSIK